MRVSRKVVGLAGTLLVLGLGWTAACGKDDDSASDAGAARDGSAGDATNVPSDATTGDGGSSSDGSAPDGDAAGCVGDRDLGVTETYPDSFLIQNGGRIYNVKSPPTSKQMPAKGNGVDDDTHALQDAWQFLKDEFAAHDNDNYPGGYIVYLPAGTYLVSDTIIYPGASLEAPTGDDWIDVVHVRFAGESRETTS